ncbi:MAG: nitroreductase/quinone reductase family protein [Acidimicrobiia bacterium]
MPVAAWLYRRSRGRIARLYRRKVMVLTTTGRRSGEPRTVVVQYFADGRDMVVVAANSGMPSHPAWYLNLMANPHAIVETDGNTIDVEASALSSEEAAAFWPRVLEAAPDYARFPQRTDRAIPLVRLSPAPLAVADAAGPGTGATQAGPGPRLPGTPKPWMNAAMRTLLRTPGLRRQLGKSFAVITVTGAKTARRYSTPVQYLRIEDHYIVLSQTTRRWWRNIATEPAVELSIASRVVHGQAVIAQEAHAYRLANHVLEANPKVARFYRVRVDATHGVATEDIDRFLEHIAVIDIAPGQASSGPRVEMVTIRSGPHPMSGFVATPTAAGRRPGVIVIHDALGPTTDLKNQVRWLAAEGFLTVAPDLYSRGGRLRCMFSAMRALAAGHGPTFDDLAATREWLEARPDCTGQIGVIGFCLGGGYALALAGTGHFDVASANYGDAPSYEPDHFSQACPIIATYGQLDRSLRGAPDRLDAALNAVGIDHEIITYPGAGHGFLNDHPPDETPPWASIAGRLAVTGYHPPSASDARNRITAFFDRHLCDADTTA